MKKLMMLTAAALMVQAVPSIAQDGGKEHKRGKFVEHMVQKMDTDKDGAISEAEFQASSKTRFDAMDANKDGKLTQEEIKAHHEAKRAEWKAKKAQRKAEKPVEAPAAE